MWLCSTRPPEVCRASFWRVPANTRLTIHRRLSAHGGRTAFGMSCANKGTQMTVSQRNHHQFISLFSGRLYSFGTKFAQSKDLRRGLTTMSTSRRKPGNDLLNQTDGFFGDGVYRQHFFGDASTIELRQESNQRAGALLRAGPQPTAAQACAHGHADQTTLTFIGSPLRWNAAVRRTPRGNPDTSPNGDGPAASARRRHRCG